jgi:hypothetical protein
MENINKINVLVTKFIHYFIFLMLFVLCVVFTSCRTVRQPTNIPVMTEVGQDNIDVLITVEGIPIMAYWGVQEYTVERYLELKEAGIDFNFSYHADVETLAKAMDAAKTAGVRMIIHCWGLENEPEKLVNRFKDHPALVGYYLQDEPNRNDFSRLGEFVRRIHEIDKQHFCYVNLFPNYVDSEALLPETTYRGYVQSFLQEVSVPFLSFDHYPIGANNSGVRSMNSGWYENLEIISDETRKAGKSFWAFALTTAFGPYPVPTLADLRLQVYSNFAYGAQGIQYFTYWTPSTSEGEDFHDGPIDYITQQKTATWYTVQEMSREIKNLSSVFLGAQVIKVEHIGTSIPKGTMRFDFTKRPKEANIIKTFSTPNNTNALVSFLKNGNRCYMVVVNRNLSGGSDVIFTITGDKGLQLVKKDGTAVDASKAGSSQTVTPGNALIYGWDK